MREDCFAASGGYCCALSAARCKRCAFYKTREQLDMERQAVNRRLEQLPADRRQELFYKYTTGWEAGQ